MSTELQATNKTIPRFDIHRALAPFVVRLVFVDGIEARKPKAQEGDVEVVGEEADNGNHQHERRASSLVTI